MFDDMSHWWVALVVPAFTTLMAATLWLFGRGRIALTGANASRTTLVVARFVHFAELVVADLQVTLRPQLAQAAVDGKLTRVEIDQLRATAVARLKAMAGDQGLIELQETLKLAAPGLEVWLSGLVESAVSRLKPAPIVSQSAILSP